MSCGCSGGGRTPLRETRGPEGAGSPSTRSTVAGPASPFGPTRDRPVLRRRGEPVLTPPVALTPPKPTNTIWGPILWSTIHSLTLYDLSATSVIGARGWREFVDLLLAGLPCRECTGHLQEWVGGHSLDDGAPAAAIHAWFVDLHNAVNQRLQKPIWSLSMVQERYTTADPDMMLINLCTSVGGLDEYMEEDVAARLRQMIDLLLRS
jgi:hypothetical protein